MEKTQMLNYIKQVLKNMPSDWLSLTTHRLDIYDEKLAKVEFLQGFEKLAENNNAEKSALSELPTAYDYIRLGHPLSSVLEWTIAQLLNINAESVVSFSSRTAPVLAILRKNFIEGKNTRIIHVNQLPKSFDAELIHRVYGYQFETQQVGSIQEIQDFAGTTIFVTEQEISESLELPSTVDFLISMDDKLGSILIVNGHDNKRYISEIQHVRRRETIAMTPDDCFLALEKLSENGADHSKVRNRVADQNAVEKCIQEITATDNKPLIGSSGLSVQYAIMMGLVDHALETYPGKDIKFIVPPNCYGGTNDQARRVAACNDRIEIVDLLVDRENNMVQSIDAVLEAVASQDAVPYIIVEIPTNPRVEVPDLGNLRTALRKSRTTSQGTASVAPVFILDQTFCPNVRFLGEEDILSGINAISYVSGSKFPSGGKCTAGYCVANQQAAHLMGKIETHLKLCDNEATDLQMELLAQQLPSMNERIEAAYQYTREFVNFIQQTLPEAKINFVSEELAKQGFTPSVFSLDLPTKGGTDEEREAYKRALNLKLIDSMIKEIPEESKYCVSYGQLKGCYWTIPATSTQGTTKEGDKDYIARVALSANMDLERHKKVFAQFAASI
uniref:cystathionine beta-synthase n=1 Tax=Fulvivirga sp. TaxID=1931237 RepID=UPI004049DA30